MYKFRYVLIDMDDEKNNDYKIYEIDIPEDFVYEKIGNKIFEIEGKNPKFEFHCGFFDLEKKQIDDTRSIHEHAFLGFEFPELDETISNLIKKYPKLFEEIYVYLKKEPPHRCLINGGVTKYRWSSDED